MGHHAACRLLFAQLQYCIQGSTCLECATVWWAQGSYTHGWGAYILQVHALHACVAGACVLCMCMPHPFWKISHLKNRLCPDNRSRVEHVNTGVTWACGAMRSAAALMSSSVAAYVEGPPSKHLLCSSIVSKKHVRLMTNACGRRITYSSQASCCRHIRPPPQEHRTLVWYAAALCHTADRVSYILTLCLDFWRSERGRSTAPLAWTCALVLSWLLQLLSEIARTGC